MSEISKTTVQKFLELASTAPKDIDGRLLTNEAEIFVESQIPASKTMSKADRKVVQGQFMIGFAIAVAKETLEMPLEGNDTASPQKIIDMLSPVNPQASTALRRLAERSGTIFPRF